jgi:hypothetical protein
MLLTTAVLAAMASGDAFASAPRLSASATASHLFIRASKARTLYDQIGG